MKAQNYFAIDTGAYFASEKPNYVIIQDTDDWKVYYSGHYIMSSEFSGELSELEPNEYGPSQWVPVEIDIEKLKKYFARNAKPEKWRNFTKAFEKKHQPRNMCDGPHVGATWMIEGKKTMNVWFYGFLDSEDLHPHYQQACRMLRYLNRNGNM